MLEGLAADHEVPRLVLEYRQLTKLKSTYVDALPMLIRGESGRVQTYLRILAFSVVGLVAMLIWSSLP